MHMNCTTDRAILYRI